MPRSLPRRRNTRPRVILIGVALVLLLIFGRSLCALFIDYLWWSEMNQVTTWMRLSAYRYLTGITEWVLVFAVMWVAHARGLKYAGTGLRDNPLYGRLATLVLAFLALIVSAFLMEGWVLARFVAGSGVPSTWQDPVFGRSLSFYFFELPFYRQLVGVVETVAAVAALTYYLTARGWQIRREFPGLLQSGQVEWTSLRELGRLETGLLQFLMALFLAGLAVSFWLDRYELLYTDHGNLLVGMDYVQQHVNLPLQTIKAAAAVLAAVLVLARKRRWALACAVVLVFDIAVPPLVSGLYVKPNELALEKPFLVRHIEATRAGFGLDRRAHETEFNARKEGRIDFVRNRATLDNVRLWDWRAFHDTLSQSQPLRPYTYADTDVDRYRIEGQLRQVLLAPRELDLSQLGDAQNSWTNANLTFTHSYGVALAEANRITPAGLPELLIRDAPVQVLTPSLKVTRPEIYYSERAHEPVFVRTRQPEFNYPSGSSEVSTRYDGLGGFGIGSSLVRLIASIAQGDWNIVLTNQFTPESRMMVHRRVLERLETLAEFIRWDTDPYMVISDQGRLVWIVDGYMVSSAQPYAREVSLGNGESFNYIRNSVKATIDAYDGTVRLYVFDPEDPMVLAYQRLFPTLFTPASEMPADLRAHTRAPEVMFRVQAEMYRTYHMRDPESFYNRADLWDLATSSQNGRAEPVAPTYMVAMLPGESEVEFLLMIPFTPRGKQNLIGLMMTRCDGEHLGEIVYYQLPKQEIIPGPLQIDALINQDQVISKDLTLWNQQGSQVLRSQILILPIDQTFLYVAPIYIQAAQARMPQLEKVVLAVDNTLVYEDRYEQALMRLQAILSGKAPPPSSAPTQTSAAASGSAQTAATQTSPPPQPGPAGSDARINAIRGHLQRYRDLSAQGRWSEAGKELEAIEAETRK